MAKEAKFEFDLNRITYKELLALDDKDLEGKDNRMSLEMLIQTLVSWPFDLEITVENVENLGLVDFAELQGAFNDELDAVFQRFRKSE